MKYEKFHSQFGEDKWLVDNNILPKEGVFVDVGAGDPVDLSNTFHFEKNGWDGICIEADKSRIEKLKQFRKIVECGVVFSCFGKMKFFENNNCSDISRISDCGEIRDTFPLTHFLDKHLIKRVDLLSLDVEGYELNVLSKYILEKYNIDVIIIEFLTTGKSQEKEIMDFFSDKDYNLIHKTTANLIFKKK